MEIGYIEEFMDRVWNDKQLSHIRELFHEKVICHSPLGDHVGPERFTDIVRTWLSAFSDLQVTRLHCSQEGETVVVHWMAQGTHTGDFKGVAASSRPVRYHGISYYRMEEGKVVEYWACVDMLSLIGQITGERALEMPVGAR